MPNHKIVAIDNLSLQELDSEAELIALIEKGNTQKCAWDLAANRQTNEHTPRQTHTTNQNIQAQHNQ